MQTTPRVLLWAGMTEAQCGLLYTTQWSRSLVSICWYCRATLTEVPSLALPRPGCVPLDKLLSLPQSQSPLLKNGDNNKGCQ